MQKSLKNLPFEIWKNNIERQGILPTFSPLFERYIGVEDNKNSYADILATIKKKADEDKTHTIIFDNEIPLVPDFNFMTAIKAELQTMNVTSLSTQNIKMFQDLNYNNHYLKCLEEVVNFAISKENYPNEGVRNNFICELLLNTFNFICPLQVDSSYTNKCIYYGDIKKSNVYFLILLVKLGFDVIYINSGKDSNELRDLTNSNLYEYSLREGTSTLKEWTRNGKPIEQSNSVTLDLQNQMDAQLFSNTGVYRPWQFKEKGTTKSLFFNSTLIDVDTNWNEDSKVRAGFKVEGMTVTVPNFFWEVEGEYENNNKYTDLIQKCLSSSNNLLVISKSENVLFDSIAQNPSNKEALLKLVFCQNHDMTFDIEKVKQLDFYNYSKYNDATENLILNKMNEVIKDMTMFQKVWNKNEIIEFAFNVLSLSTKVILSIDNFDYTSKIPKLIYFLEDDTSLQIWDINIIALLNKIGYDIIIFSPAGVSDLSSYIKRERFNSERLDKVSYDRKFNQVKESKPKSFFKKLFS